MSNIHGLGSAPSGGNRGNAPRGPSGGQGDSEPGCLDKIKGGYNGLPLFNRYLVNIILFLYLVSWVWDPTPYLALVPYHLASFQGKLIT